jgi:hypothetical protein
VEWTFPYQARRKGAHFTLPVSGRPIVPQDPELGDLSPAEGRYLRGYLRAADRAVAAEDGTWRRYLDEPATIDYVLVQELFRNVDAFHGSTFLVKESGRKLRFGPVWDFDLSSGNARQGTSGRTEGWWTPSKDWAGRLWQDCAYRAALGARWRELQSGGFSARLLARLDGYRTRLSAGPAGRNFRRWPTLDQRLWQSPDARGSYTAEVAFLRDWLSRRMTGWTPPRGTCGAEPPAPGPGARPGRGARPSRPPPPRRSSRARTAPTASRAHPGPTSSAAATGAIASRASAGTTAWPGTRRTTSCARARGTTSSMGARATTSSTAARATTASPAAAGGTA